MRFRRLSSGRLVPWLTAQSHRDQLKRLPLGHSRPNWAVRAMSGLPPLATTERTSLEVGRSIDAAAAAAGSGSADSRRLVPRLSSTPAARVRLDGKAARRSANDA